MRPKADQVSAVYSRRVANGTLRRTAYLDGDLVAEVRLYNEADIRGLEGLERCEKSVVWLRYQGDSSSPEFAALKQFIRMTKEKFTEEGTFYQEKKKK